MMIPETDASNKVMTRMGHDPDSEPSSGLLVSFMFFTKNATPGDSTVIKILISIGCKSLSYYI